MNDLKIHYRKQCNALAKDYLVPDFVTDKTKFLFLLESPHVQELLHGAPVSGSSGASMSKYLFGEQYERLALGRIVKKNAVEQLSRPSIDKAGLMNVCQIPLQKAAYSEHDVQRSYAELFAIFASIRSANHKTAFQDPGWNAVQEILAESLRRKLERLRSQVLYIVPCGRFAQKFFRLAGVTSPSWSVIEGIPHPSYNGWSKSEYQPAVQQLIALFQKS